MSQNDCATNAAPMRVLIAYHANCTDGFTSAWVTLHAMRDRGAQESNIILLPVQYGKEKEILKHLTSGYNIQLYIVDFSVSVELLEEIAVTYPDVATLILDHHKSAFESYAGISKPAKDEIWEGLIHGAHIRLDNNQSGASLCWYTFSTNSKAPNLVLYVKDYDLWRFRYSWDTKYINKYLNSLDKNIANWNIAANELEHPATTEAILAKGKILYEVHMEVVNSFVSKAVPITLEGVDGLFTQCPYPYCSDVGHELAVKCGTFGLMLTSYDEDTLAKFNYSLRSIGDYDCAAVAQVFGGGGHKGAAGFSTQYVLGMGIGELS